MKRGIKIMEKQIKEDLIGFGLFAVLVAVLIFVNACMALTV